MADIALTNEVEVQAERAAWVSPELSRVRAGDAESNVVTDDDGNAGLS